MYAREWQNGRRAGLRTHSTTRNLVSSRPIRANIPHIFRSDTLSQGPFCPPLVMRTIRLLSESGRDREVRRECCGGDRSPSPRWPFSHSILFGRSERRRDSRRAEAWSGMRTLRSSTTVGPSRHAGLGFTHSGNIVITSSEYLSPPRNRLSRLRNTNTLRRASGYESAGNEADGWVAFRARPGTPRHEHFAMLDGTHAA